MKEIFKSVKGFESHYEISNKGNFRNIVTDYYPNKTINAYGYQTVFLKIGDIKKTKSIHRMVAEAFIPNPDNFPLVNHINSKKLNNHVDNLEWVTPRENYCHAEKAAGKKTSKYSGVCWVNRLSKYWAQGCINKKRFNLGMFKTEEAAYEAVKQFHTENNIINRYL